MRRALIQYQILQKSVSLIESQQYDQAKQFVDKILQTNKENSLALFNKGLIFYQEDQFKEAIQYFSKALTFDKNNDLIIYNLGTAYKAIDDLDKALSCFDQCLSKNSNNTQAVIQKVEILRLKNQYIEAEKLLSNQQKKEPYNLDLLLELIELKLFQQEYKQATNYVPFILSLKDFSSDSLILIANSFIAAKLFQSAISILDKVLSQDSTNQEALLNRGIIEYTYDKLEDAVEYFVKVINLNPKLTQALLYLGLTFAQLNKLEEAIDILDKLLEINENDATIWNNKGIVYMELNNFPQAIQCFNQALKINPQNPLYKINKAQVLIQTEPTEGAKLLLEAKQEFIKLKDNNLFTSTNIKYMEEKINLLLPEQREYQIESGNFPISNIDSFNQAAQETKEQYHQRQNTEEVQSVIIVIPKEQQRRDKSIIQQSCVIKNSIEISEGESNIQFGQNFSIKKQLMRKYEQLQEFNKEVEERIKKIEDQIKEVGIDKRAQINEQLKTFQKTAEGLNQLSYFKAFFWTLYNYILTYNLQSTQLYTFNNNQTIETQTEKLVSYFETGLAVGGKLSSPFPVVSNVISSVHSAIQSLFNLYKDNKHQDRIDYITQIVSNKIINVSDLELQISVAALELAQKKLNIIKDLQLYKPTYSKDFASQLRTIVKRMIDSKSSLYQGGAAELGLEDAMNCLGYFYQNGLMDEEEEFSTQVVNIIILKKHLILRAEQVDSRASCTCSIF